MFVCAITSCMALASGFARLALVVCLVFYTGSCTYLKYVSVQAEHARIQNAKPGQLNVKHMMDRETYFVSGSAREFDTNPDFSMTHQVVIPISWPSFSVRFSLGENL